MTARFRLTMATQTGEKLARDEGFSAFPVDPIAIARKHGIHVEQKPPDMKGISGALIFADPSPIIIYSTEHANEGFENFSVAHELGHYFLPGHPDEIMKAGGAHMSRSGFSQGDSSIELEADHFAAGLLMPSYLVRKSLGSGQIGLKGIRDMAGQATASLTAAAIRAAECAEHPMCIIVSEGPTVPGRRGPDRHAPSPPRSAAAPAASSGPDRRRSPRRRTEAGSVRLGRPR